jgi:hypothetical protein
MALLQVLGGRASLVLVIEAARCWLNGLPPKAIIGAEMRRRTLALMEAMDVARPKGAYWTTTNIIG